MPKPNWTSLNDTGQASSNVAKKETHSMFDLISSYHSFHHTQTARAGPAAIHFLNLPIFFPSTSFLLATTGVPLSSTAYCGRFDQAVGNGGRVRANHNGVHMSTEVLFRLSPTIRPTSNIFA
jgi:hypothetical protein